MLLADKVKNFAQSEIFKLEYNNKVLGLRVKLFDINTDTFTYYDFSLETVASHTGVRDFVNSLQSTMKVIPLREYNSLLASDDEINGNITVTEFKDTAFAVNALKQVQLAYEYRKKVL